MTNVVRLNLSRHRPEHNPLLDPNVQELNEISRVIRDYFLKELKHDTPIAYPLSVDKLRRFIQIIDERSATVEGVMRQLAEAEEYIKKEFTFESAFMDGYFLATAVGKIIQEKIFFIYSSAQKKQYLQGIFAEISTSLPEDKVEKQALQVITKILHTDFNSEVSRYSQEKLQNMAFIVTGYLSEGIFVLPTPKVIAEMLPGNTSTDFDTYIENLYNCMETYVDELLPQKQNILAQWSNEEPYDTQALECLVMRYHNNDIPLPEKIYDESLHFYINRLEGDIKWWIGDPDYDDIREIISLQQSPANECNIVPEETGLSKKT